MKKFILFLFFAAIFIGCTEHTPKPTGFNRIDKPTYTYKQFDAPDFSIQYAGIATIETVQKGDKSGYWFNILYPNYQATIYCSYIPVTTNSLKDALNDSYHLAYSHTSKANDINPTIFQDYEKKINGTIYDLTGDVATPIQFFVTDSVSHFLRGSLYFDNQVNTDSIAPVVQYIRTDIQKIIENINWK